MQNAKEQVFQQDIIDHLVSNGWKLGRSGNYDPKHALYPEDLVGYLSDTQPDQWEKFSRMHPKGAEQGHRSNEGTVPCPLVKIEDIIHYFPLFMKNEHA